MRPGIMNSTSGAEPPDNDGMEARVAKLEALTEKTGDRLYSIEKDIAVIKNQLATFATKEDMHREFGSSTWRIVGIVVIAQLLPAIPGLLKAMHWMP